MFSSGDIITSLDDESFLVLVVVPSGLPWSLMVEHICVWHEPISLDVVHCDAENSAGNHHSNFRIFSQRKFFISWDLLANEVIINFDIFNFLINLVQKWGSLQKLLLFWSEEYREVSQALWENIHVLRKRSDILSLFLQKICS